LTRFFSQATHTTDIYTLSLHDALPISRTRRCERNIANPVRKLHGKDARGKSQRDETQNSHRRPVLRSIALPDGLPPPRGSREERDRKSTRLNSSHVSISYAVFCLKKKK